jgi:lysine 2,3-aminomutase
VRIMQALRGHTSGMAVPHFVIDAPGGGGKIPVNADYVVKRDGKRWVLRNFAGQEYEYTEP